MLRENERIEDIKSDNIADEYAKWKHTINHLHFAYLQRSAHANLVF